MSEDKEECPKCGETVLIFWNFETTTICRKCGYHGADEDFKQDYAKTIQPTTER